MATKFCTFAPNIRGSSVWNLLRVTLLEPRILWWLPDFWKTCDNLSCIFRSCFLPFLRYVFCVSHRPNMFEEIIKLACRNLCSPLLHIFPQLLCYEQKLLPSRLLPGLIQTKMNCRLTPNILCDLNRI